MPIDVTPHIQAKSDQLNADDLLGGPITVQITKAHAPGGEQPVVLRLSGGHMPYKPCKTMLRLMVAAWGTTDAERWEGRWLTLYRDANVNSPDGTKGVGGIRISHMSHIDEPRTYMLAEKRGKKRPWKVKPLRTSDQRQSGEATADLDAVLADNELTRDDVDRWLATQDKPPLAEVPPEKLPAFAVWLTTDPARLDAIRALIPADGAETDGGAE